MSAPLPFRKQRGSRARRDAARQDWIDERLREARIVVADMVHHSDHLVRLSCNVLVRHGQTAEERKDAQLLLVVLEAKSPGRTERSRPDREDGR